MKISRASAVSRLTALAISLGVGSIALPSITVAATTGFNQTVAGTYDYNTSGNWVGGTINGIWDPSLTLAGTQVITFATDTTLSGGLSFNYGGNAATSLTSSSTTAHTLTLAGDIQVGPTYVGSNQVNNVTIGNAANALNLDLGNATRTISVIINRTLTLSNVVSNGAIDKTGVGTLTLSGANTFSSGLTLDAGTLSLGNNAALGTGILTINGGSINVTGARTTTTNNVQNWNGDFTVVGANTLNMGTGAVTLNGNRAVTVSASTLTVGGAIGESASGFSLTKAGAGTMILTGANTYSGGTTVNGGILQFNAGALPASGLVTINSGGILNSTGALSTVTAWLAKITTGSTGVLALTGNSSENINFTSYNTLMLGASAASTYSGALTPAGTTYRLGGGGNTLTVTQALTGSGNSLVVGLASSTGTVVLTAANTYTGATILNSGTLSLSGATGSAASSAITANAGSALTIDGSTATGAGTTRAASVTLKGASLNVLGNATANSSDTITGALTVDAPSAGGLGAGANTVTVTPNAATNAQLTAASLVRANNGAVFFRGTNLGANTIASATLNTSNIVFTTAPTAQLVGGGGLAGTQNISILPWAVGATTAGGVPSSFVTYDANGIRPLASGEYDTTIPAAASTNNVKLSAASPVTVDGSTTVNSLFLSNAASNTTIIAAGTAGSLTVTSGAIYADLSLGGNSIALTISKPIDFGTAQGVIGTLGTASSKTLSFTGGISGSGGITIYDTGTLSSTQAGVNLGATTYTGDTIINGTLIASNPNALPNFANGGRTGDVYVNGTLGLSGANGGSIRINGLFGNGKIVTPFTNGETLIVGDNNATSTFGGTIIQGSGVIALTKVGTGVLTLTGINNYTGPTTVSGGSLVLDVINGGSISATTPVTIGTGGNFAINGAAGPASPTVVVLASLATSSLTGTGLGLNMLTLNNGVNLSASTLTSGGLTLVRGNRLGLDARGTAGSTNVTFITTPTLVGSGSAGSSTVGVIANMLGDTSASGIGTGFVTYDAITGLRLLTAGETTGTVTAGSNVKLTGSTASVTATVNSLEIGTGGQITGTNTITVSNNILLISGVNSGSTATINRSSTTNDFYIVANSDFTTTGAINNGGSGTSIYKLGSGTVTIGGSNDGGFVVDEGTLAATTGINKTRSITVNGGTFKFLASSMQIGGQGLTINSGGTADFNGTTSSAIVLNGAGTATNTAGTTGTLVANSGTFSGNITSNLNVSKLTVGALILSGANTYSGNTTVSAGTFTLANSGSMTFYIGANGINNSVTGVGTAAFNGTFAFNLSGASLVDGNSWTIVNVTTQSFAGSFIVQGFTENFNVWSNGSGLSFSEASGILSYTAIPEPSTYALFAGAGLLLFALIRRKIRSSRAA